MAINAYVSDSSSTISVHVSDGTSANKITADVNSIEPTDASVSSIQLVPTNSDWATITNKPFNSVDNKTLSTEGGVLKFKTGSYETLSDLPSIEGVELMDDKTFADLGMEECSVLSIEKIFSS